MEKLNKRIEGIRKLMEDMKDEKYAVSNPELAVLDEYTKTLYLKVLCTVVQYENVSTNMQLLYLKRIVKGMSVEEPMEEYLRKALEISDTDIRDFLSLMKENTAKYYFVLDSLILTAMGNASQANKEYLAELAELCDVKKSDLEYLCMVAKSVIQQQSSLYDEAKKQMNERVEKMNLLPYIENYYTGAYVDTNEKVVYSAPTGCELYKMSYPSKYVQRKVVFQNLDIEVSTEWNFNGCEEVVFKNCRVRGSKNGRLFFHSVGSIYFEDCRFTDFSNRVAIVERVSLLSSVHCEYVNCGYSHTGIGDVYGGVFYLREAKNTQIKIFGNTVYKCYLTRDGWSNYIITGIFIGFRDGRDEQPANFKIMNNTFISCKCIISDKEVMRGELVGKFDEYCFNDINDIKFFQKDNKYRGGNEQLIEQEIEVYLKLLKENLIQVCAT